MSAAAVVPVAFVEAWIPEFMKTVEMFTSAAVAVARVDDPDAVVPVDGLLWHEQTFERQGTGRFWIGALAPDAMRLLGEGAEGEASAAALFRELVAQSLKAAAEALNTSSHPGLKGLEATSTEAPPASSARAAYLITGRGEPIPVWLQCDAAFAALVEPAAGPAQSALAPALAAQPPAAADSLHGIDLPVIVVLGRATLRVAEVLKLTVGSIVELDTRVGEPVDVCIQGVVVARGEVVSIRGNYGVRIVEVLRRNRLQVQAGSRPLRGAQPAVEAGIH